MIILIHGAIPIINQLIADRLIPHLPSNTIRMDENYWQEISNKEIDELLVVAEFVSKQGFISLVNCLNPQLSKSKKNKELIEIQILPNIHNLKKSLKKKKEVVEKNNLLQIDTSDLGFDDCLNKVKEFVLRKLKIKNV